MLQRLIRQPAFYGALYAWARGIVPLIFPAIPPLALTLTDTFFASCLSIYTGGKIYAGIQNEKKDRAERDLERARAKAARPPYGPGR